LKKWLEARSNGDNSTPFSEASSYFFKPPNWEQFSSKVIKNKVLTALST
jgi:hypothetical protein